MIFSPFCLQLGEHCSELKDIHLGQCYSITDEGMVALAKGCRKLQRLYLQENKLVSPTHLISYVLFLPACFRVSKALFSAVQLLLIFWGYKSIVRALWPCLLHFFAEQCWLLRCQGMHLLSFCLTSLNQLSQRTCYSVLLFGSSSSYSLLLWHTNVCDCHQKILIILCFFGGHTVL